MIILAPKCKRLVAKSCNILRYFLYVKKIFPLAITSKHVRLFILSVSLIIITQISALHP